MRLNCNYAQPGTYGHECGRPAIYALPLHSEKKPSGVFYSRRCESCKDNLEHGDVPLSGLVPFDSIAHQNY
jgi:hypothetical protein